MVLCICVFVCKERKAARQRQIERGLIFEILPFFCVNFHICGIFLCLLNATLLRNTDNIDNIMLTNLIVTMFLPLKIEENHRKTVCC